MSNAIYDTIFLDYQQSKQLPFRIFIEKHSLFRMVGNLNNKTLLDLACGEGIYSNEALIRGAKQVVGVDISPKMIELGNKTYANPRLSFLKQDVLTLGHIADFDIVIGAYLCNYAKSKQELTQFCKTIFNNLKPGGRFIGINDNPGNAINDYRRYKKYGFVKTTTPLRNEGDPITYTFFNSDGTSFSFDNFYFSLETYEESFIQAGFKNFQWQTLKLSEKGCITQNIEYWRTFLNYPPIIGITATKP